MLELRRPLLGVSQPSSWCSMQRRWCLSSATHWTVRQAASLLPPPPSLFHQDLLRSAEAPVSLSSLAVAAATAALDTTSPSLPREVVK